MSQEQGRGLGWDKAFANAPPGMGLLWGPEWRNEMKIEVFLLLLCLPRGKREPGVGCDTGLLETEQNG